MQKSRSSGLTLVEVLVSLAILALISVLAYRALDSTLLIRDRISNETERWRQLSFFFDRLRDDVEQVATRGPLLPSGARQAAWVGSESSLEIASLGGEKRILRRVQYRSHQGAVELSLWPAFNAAPGASAEVHSVAYSIATLRFSYLDGTRRWVRDWPLRVGSGEVPLAVRVELTMVDGTRVSRLFSVRR